jgi:membrane associated rhomboid family serine protease
MKECLIPRFIWEFISFVEKEGIKSDIMGLYDRDYTRADFQSQFRHAPQMRMTFPKISPVVKWLLIANFAVFFIGELFLPRNIIVPGLTPRINFLEKWCSVFPYSFASAIQVWRLVTYQFLHADVIHILFNMLGLFFLGPTLERHWGSRKFLIFYLSCGVAGGISYTLLVAFNFLLSGPMVGASGAILGMLAACAILFPQFVVFIFLFPVPIRVAAIGLTIMYFFFVVTRGPNAGGHAAHLAGMAAGAIYVFWQPLRDRYKSRVRTGQWEKKVTEQRILQIEVDRILQKVHDSGIHSLTHKEKKILKQATKAEQKRDRF